MQTVHCMGNYIVAYLGVGVLLEEALQLPEADLAVLLAGAAQLEHGLQLRLVPHHRHLLFEFPALTEDSGRGAKSHLGTVTGLDTVLHIHNPVRQTPKITVDVLPNKSRTQHGHFISACGLRSPQ